MPATSWGNGKRSAVIEEKGRKKEVPLPGIGKRDLAKGHYSG